MPPPARCAAGSEWLPIGEPMRIEVELVAGFTEGASKFRTFVSHVGGRG